MKQIIFAIMALIAVSSCKKDGAPAAFENGLIKTVDTYTMSDRKTEAALWLEQTITYKRTFPGGPGPNVSKMKYEYIDL